MKIKKVADNAVVLKNMNNYTIVHTIPYDTISQYIDNEQYMILDTPIVANGIIFNIYIERKDIYASEQIESPTDSRRVFKSNKRASNTITKNKHN